MFFKTQRALRAELRTARASLKLAQGGYEGARLQAEKYYKALEKISLDQKAEDKREKRNREDSFLVAFSWHELVDILKKKARKRYASEIKKYRWVQLTHTFFGCELRWTKKKQRIEKHPLEELNEKPPF